jgi:hypothetical protein
MMRLISSYWPAASPWFRKNHGWLLALLWAGGQVACWRYYHGPHLMGDGIGYVACARQLVATGQLVGAHNYYYAGYVLFISIFLKLGMGILAVALAQVGLSGLAMAAFYRTVRRLSGGRWPGAALATAVLAGWVEVQSFNPFILTESLFTSCLIFCLWALVRARDARSGALAAALLLYTATIRPNGFVAPAALVLVGLHYLWRRGHRGWAAGLAGLLAVGAGLALNRIATAFNLVATYAAGTVIFSYAPSAVAPPAGLALPPASLPPAGQFFWFIGHNFLFFSKLALLKAGYFLGWPRPWYSLAHRAWVTVVFPLLYGLAVRGLRQPLGLGPRYAAVAIVLQLGVIMLTVEEWGARFSGPFVPYWLALAALGAQGLRAKTALGPR